MHPVYPQNNSNNMVLRPAIPTMSLGQPGTHSLPSKLQEASLHGFEAIELFITDLEHLASTTFNNDNLAAAKHVRALCKTVNLSIICLQPFLFQEGLVDRSPQTQNNITRKLLHWFDIAHALGTDLIQVPSNFLPPDPETKCPRTSGDIDLIVSDLQHFADLGAQQNPPIRFVYEALAWGNHVCTWEQCYDIVLRVNRPNLGICLDTFHILGWVYADPESPSGVRCRAEQDLHESLERLRRTVDPSKVFYVQVVDGVRLAAPLDEKHEFYVEGRPSRMNWSRNARLFAFEEDRGGYLPVLEVVKAFLDTGFTGWVSLELFSRYLADPAPGVPREYARRGMVSWEKLLRKLGLYSSGSSFAGEDSLTMMHRL